MPKLQITFQMATRRDAIDRRPDARRLLAFKGNYHVSER
jgi:hypothetical protein